MGYDEEETRVLSAILLSRFTQRDGKAFFALPQTPEHVAFPPAVCRQCEEAIQRHSSDRP
ncbi:hypothetical protein C3432_14195 [Citrobacter amalonaticus]|uniref:Uncharacterized protein n=1 Tax=Citrobacter amalonaticus TaxID=35703 RepID=A0A2S4RWE5_CITAM|nr:hypothetical protein [Citrobacter amalonaticus]POT56560.1 hypothetical protein C3432_14195 [Citrobacter amalonaticus]POT75085.1 hypothetical protein C3436_14665 [Citrobacter amalonaticus]POU64614.1 hypothetical protein C3430_15685 [Citrobacter amalonaticus]POV04450.1 hypothetical protein C3424_15005 [Citrobacter amalonaticus]